VRNVTIPWKLVRRKPTRYEACLIPPRLDQTPSRGPAGKSGVVRLGEIHPSAGGRLALQIALAPGSWSIAFLSGLCWKRHKRASVWWAWQGHFRTVLPRRGSPGTRHRGLRRGWLASPQSGCRQRRGHRRPRLRRRCDLSRPGKRGRPVEVSGTSRRSSASPTPAPSRSWPPIPGTIQPGRQHGRQPWHTPVPPPPAANRITKPFSAFVIHARAQRGPGGGGFSTGESTVPATERGHGWVSGRSPVVQEDEAYPRQAR
jgi:hypothetical protein